MSINKEFVLNFNHRIQMTVGKRVVDYST